MSGRGTILPSVRLREGFELEAYIVDDRCLCGEFLAECICPEEPEDSTRPTDLDLMPASEDCR